ncbi:MAG: hypothetical protein ACEQSB_05645 [Undibacterium sp.]
MKTIICPACLGAMHVSLKRHGWMFTRVITEECRACEGLGEIPAPITTVRDWSESIRRFALLPENAADHPGRIQLAEPPAREPSPEAIARAEALIRRCFSPSRDHVPSKDGAATEFVPNDRRLLVA